MAQSARHIYLPNTLYGARAGRVVAFFGSSNTNGADEGSFGANTFPLRSGITFWDTGVDRTALGYKTIHGPEVGFVETAYAANPESIVGMTIMKRAVNGASSATMISTHAPALIADCVTAGVVPNILVMSLPTADCATTAGGIAAEVQMTALLKVFRQAWGFDLAIVLDGPLDEDILVSPGHPTFRLLSRKLCGALDDYKGEVSGCMCWVDAHEDQTHLQITHRNHDAMMLYGARAANAPGMMRLLR